MTATLFVACSSSPKEDEKAYLIKYESDETVFYVAKNAFTKEAIAYTSSDFKLYLDAECTQEITSGGFFKLTEEGLSFGNNTIGKLEDVGVTATENQIKVKAKSYTLSFTKGEYDTEYAYFEVTEDFSCVVTMNI